MRQKGFILIPILIIALLGIIALLVYQNLLLNRKIVSTSTPLETNVVTPRKTTKENPSLDPTAPPNIPSNWKTYTVSEIPLIFRYPPNWEVEKSTIDYLNIVVSPNLREEGGFVPVQISIDSTYDNQGKRIHLNTIDEVMNSTLITSSQFKNPIIKKLTVGGKEAKSIEGIIGSSGPDYGMFLHDTFVQLDKKVLIIQMGMEEIRDEFNKILSSMSFK